MEILSVSKYRQNLAHIIEKGKSIEVQHPKNTMVTVPKREWDIQQQRIEELELEIVLLKGDLAMTTNQKKFSSEEVDALLAKVMGDV